MTEIKDARVEFKTTKEIKILLQEGANALGMDLTNFLVSVATQKAKALLLEDKILKLSKDEWKNFEEQLKNRAKPTKELKNLMNLKGFNE